MTPGPGHRVTPAAPVTLSGVGLFSGAPATITIEPAQRPSGIVFVRGGREIPARIDRLCDRPVHPAFARMRARCTSVGDEGASVATIEHLMSALAGLGVTDARVGIDAPGAHAEVPIMDGSSVEFVREIRAVGLTTLDAPADPVRVRERIVIASGDASITIEPGDSAHYAYTLDYGDGPLERAKVDWDADADEYAMNIAPARTFCMAHEAAAMRSLGLFTHLTERDMLVIDDAGPIDNEYRLDNECARHKLLDLIGDLALVGGPLIASVTAVRSGHALAHEAARAIVARSR